MARFHSHTAGGCDAVAAILAIDAPVGLTLRRIAFVGDTHAIFADATGATGATGGSPATTDDPTTDMISAVVSDLKAKLTELSHEQPVWRAVAPLA